MSSRKKFYAVAKGNTKGIFTSWSMCRLSTDGYQGSCFKGFPDVDGAVNFLSPYYATCKTICVYDDVGNMKSVTEYGHQCYLCSKPSAETESATEDKSECSIPPTESDKISKSTGGSQTDSDSELSDYQDLLNETFVMTNNAHENQNMHELTLLMEQTHVKTIDERESKKCGVCKLNENDNMIKCNTCSEIIHYSCTNLPPYMLCWLNDTRQIFSCQKCVSVPPEFDKKTDFHFKNDHPKIVITCDTQTEDSYQNMKNETQTSSEVKSESEIYLEMAVNRFQETVIASINTLDRDVPKQDSSEIMDKFKSLEKSLTEGLESLKEMVRESRTEQAKIAKNIATVIEKVNKNSQKIDKVQKDIENNKPEENPSLLENVEQCCMTVPIISNSTRENSKKLEEIQETLNTTAASIQDQGDKIEKISENLNSSERMVPSYACATKNRFSILQEESSIFDQKLLNDENDSLLFEDHQVTKENNTMNKGIQNKQDNVGNGKGDKPVRNINKSEKQQRTEINRDSKKTTPPASQNRMKKALLLGNSHLRPIRTYNFMKGCFVKKQLCFTVDKALSFIESNTISNYDPYDCIVIHLFTNDLKGPETSPETICSKYETLVDNIHDKWPETKVVFSLGICRGDSEELNSKLQECNIILQHRFLHKKFVILCDNSDLGYRGKANYWYLKRDQVHLNFAGTKILVSNLKYSMSKAMNVKRVRFTNSSPQQHWGEYGPGFSNDKYNAQYSWGGYGYY